MLLLAARLLSEVNDSLHRFEQFFIEKGKCIKSKTHENALAFEQVFGEMRIPAQPAKVPL
tara:strand:+ start:1192 stop:1371 length:180 start_codon:yes stop_codon:yes gene_type:complete